MLLPVILLILLSLSINCHTDPPPKTVSRFISQNESLFKIQEDQEYTFGYLEVPENRSKASSNTIKLPVYIFNSRHPSPPKDPIIYVVGGPGASVMSAAP